MSRKRRNSIYRLYDSIFIHEQEGTSDNMIAVIPPQFICRLKGFRCYISRPLLLYLSQAVVSFLKEQGNESGKKFLNLDIVYLNWILQCIYNLLTCAVQNKRVFTPLPPPPTLFSIVTFIIDVIVNLLICFPFCFLVCQYSVGHILVSSFWELFAARAWLIISLWEVGLPQFQNLEFFLIQ